MKRRIFLHHGSWEWENPQFAVRSDAKLPQLAQVTHKSFLVSLLSIPSLSVEEVHVATDTLDGLGTLQQLHRIFLVGSSESLIMLSIYSLLSYLVNQVQSLLNLSGTDVTFSSEIHDLLHTESPTRDVSLLAVCFQTARNASVSLAIFSIPKSE